MQGNTNLSCHTCSIYNKIFDTIYLAKWLKVLPRTRL